MRRIPKLTTPLVSGLILFMGACTPAPIPTPLELVEGDILTSHQEMMAFLDHLQEETGAFTMETIGTSVEGRDIVVLGFEGEGNSAQGDRLKVLLFAQQHGNEPSGMEGMLTLARDIATGAYAGFQDHVDLYLVPQVNPDGGEKEQRRNAEDFDLNRDHLPLYTPEVRAIHGLFKRLLPEVTLDVHEYGNTGSSWAAAGVQKDFGHQIGTNSNPNIPETLRRYGVEKVMPQMMEALASRDVPLNRYILVNGPDARIRYSTAALNDGRNALGIYHSLSFLIEGEKGPSTEGDIKERARKQMETMKAFVNYFAEHAGEVKEMVDTEREALTSNSLPPRVAIVMDYVADPENPELSMGVKDLETGEAKRITVEEYHPKVQPSLWVDRPMGYAIPGDLSNIIEALERHGITFETLDSATPATLESYRIVGTEQTIMEDKDFLAVDVSVARGEGVIPAGSVVVWCNQMASNVIVTLLEPQSQWGLAPLPEFVSMLTEGTDFPIQRIVGIPD